MPSVLDDISGGEPLLTPGKAMADKDPGPIYIPHVTKPKLELRAFGDAAATRKAVYENVLRAAQGIQPISNTRHTLSLNDVDYADPPDLSIRKHKDALLSGKSLYRRLRGTWRLHDNETGKLLDEQHSTVAHVPYLSKHGTFVMNGTDYVLRHQMRLNPGVFARVKENGELESHVNVLPGKGLSHRYFLDPETGVFKINIGQAKLPLMPVLRAMGVKDSDVRDAWGPDITAANASASDSRVIDKLYAKLVRRGDPSAEPQHKKQAVADAISRMELDPDITARTLGKPYKNMNAEAILASTKKLLDISRGHTEPDDRDHLAFQTLYGPEDLLAERLTKDKSYMRQLLWRATTRGNLKHVQPGTLTKQVHAALLHSGLGQAVEEINNAELLDAQTSVTRLGEGGIGSIEAIPVESRAVQPSHFGFIDPVRTPECLAADSEVMTKGGWKTWPAITMADELACQVDGQLTFHKPEHLYARRYCGTMYGARSKWVNYLATPNHRMYTKPRGRDYAWRMERADYVHGKPRTFLCNNRLPAVGATECAFDKRMLTSDNYYTEEYDGLVYCATVPGGMLFVRRSTGCGYWTGNSFHVGVDTRLSSESRKGNDGRIYAPFIDVASGRKVYKSPQDIADKVVAFPGEMKSGEPYVYAQAGGTTKAVPRESVDYELPHFEGAFSPLGNMIPGKSALKGQRMAMGSRYLAQALSLKAREAPYFQSAVPGTNSKRSYEEHYGEHLGAIRAEQGGRVTKITPDEITVKQEDGTTKKYETYNHHPYARKSVSGTTQIFFKRGNTVCSCFIADYEWQTGDLTLSVDPATKTSAWMPVTAYVRHRNDKKLLRVRTESGREVVVTSDHSLMTIGDDGNLVPVYPQDCVINRTRLPLALVPSAKTEDENSYALGLLVGLYLSEGHCPPSQPGQVLIAVQDDNRAAEVMQLLDNSGYWPWRNGGVIGFTDHNAARYLINNYGHLSHGKYIPDWALNASKTFRNGIIVGYMGGDGCLWEVRGGYTNVCAVSVSKRLRDGMVNLLSTLGIFTTLWDAPRAHLNENWRDGYGFRVTRNDLPKLPRWFFYADRELKLRDLLQHDQRVRSSPFELVPVYSKPARQLLYAGFEKTPSYVHKTAHAGVVAKRFLAEANGVYGDWGRSDVLWDKVVAIEPVCHEEFVYDLSVQGAEAFAVCHGLIVHNTFLHNEAAVDVGQAIKPGELLANSNFTDDKGTSALGLNARVAFIPMHGANYEDAAIISQSMGDRLTSQHMYMTDQEWTDRHAKGKKSYSSLFPAVYDRKMLDKMDEHGVVKPGTVLHYGDPIVLAAELREEGHSKIHRGRKPAFADKTQTWDHHAPGVVTDVSHTGKGTTVAVKSEHKMEIGDKLSNRFGGKGVVSEILPDDQMPHDAQGKPYEILLNPEGVISRINPVQIAEMVLGKITAKTGRPYKLEDFADIKDLTEFAKQEAKKYGINEKEPVIDPRTGRRIRDPFTGKDPLTGHQYLLKLHHTSESKSQGRGIGGYTAEGLPARGGPEGSKRLALLETSALLSHGATETLRDAHLIRGQKNDQYWQAFMSGHRPADPQVPLVYHKFLASLQASGINPVRQGSRTQVLALTDNDINKLAGDRELQNSETVDWKEGLKPRKGGLFDQALTGGHNGNKWSYVKLHEPLPNPVFEEPIRRLLGITQANLEGVIAGRTELGGKSGPKAVWDALDHMDVKKELEKARTEIKGSRAGARDAAVRKLGYLKDLDRLDMHPRDWMQTKVPVIPPAFRPVSVMAGSGTQLVSDANYLYKELMDSNDVLKQLTGKVDDVGQEKLNLYNAFKAVVGLGDPTHPKNQERRVQGLLKHVFGSNAKLSMMQRQLLGATVDVVGRAVITPNPDFDMDQVGLPETRAWSVYQPFIIRRLVQRGVSRLEAVQAVKDKKPMARDAMAQEMQARPVVISRAPVLHKFGIQAFWPRLVKGDVMQISPLITAGFNADFDGDTMSIHLPVSEEAREEAIHKLLPSRNLFSPSNFGVHVLPRHEYLGGLYAATAAKDKAVQRPRVFATKQDAIAAYKRGEIGVETPVQVAQH